MWNFRESIKNNPKARSLYAISLALFFCSIMLPKLFSGKLSMLGYTAVVCVILFTFTGLYDYSKNKHVPFVHDTKLGYFYAFIGSAFFLSTIATWYESVMPMYALILALISSICQITVGYILITKK